MTIHQYLFYQKKYEQQYGVNKTLVLMMIGSFYEAYATKTEGHDLKKISELLNIVLTRKDKNKTISNENPYMLGFPTVSLNKYLKVLISTGYTIIMVDQVTPPPKPKREVTAIYSPGTYIEESFSSDSNNIVSLYIEDELQKNGSILTCVGMSVVDLSTGKNCIYEAYSLFGDEKFALDEAVRFINSYNPKEVIIYKKENNKMHSSHLSITKTNLILYLELESKNCHYYSKINKTYHKISYQNEFLNKIYHDTGMLSPLEYLNLERKPYATVSYIVLMDFAFQHNENIIDNLLKPEIFNNNKHLVLGNNAIFQLNILENTTIDSFNQRFKSLFDVVNKTSTAIGRRFLKNSLVSPIININDLQKRYDSIDEALNDNLYIKLENHLNGILDIERLHRKLALTCLHPFEMANLLYSYDEIIKLIMIVKKTNVLNEILPKSIIIEQLLDFQKYCINTFNTTELEKYNINEIENSFFIKGIYDDIDNMQQNIYNNTNFMENLCTVLSKFVEDNGNFATKNNKSVCNENKIFVKKNDRDGHFLLLTAKRAVSLKQNIANIEEIKINKNYALDPKTLIFKNLPKGGTKIFFEGLKNISDKLILNREHMMTMMKDTYVQFLDSMYQKYKKMFSNITKFIGLLDFIKSAAKTAKLYSYKKPVIIPNNNGFIRCKQLRHPIIERINTDTEYIPHDISIGSSSDDNSDDNNIDGILLFGLNASGKSTLMKAIGISIIMAQTGMYVPATEYKYSPYDSMYGRITGNDNIFKGLSSFALEMTELRAILKRTGPKTLVIGDEVCRGTEYISGSSIVAATVINLAKTGSSFIFASHLHELPKIEKIKKLKNIKSLHLTVEYDKASDSLIFDRKLKEGSGTTLYGITVARYIIHDNEFIKLAQEIKNDLMNVPNKILNDKTSNYNSNVYMHECGICHQIIKLNEFGNYIDSHHINEQKDCIDGFVKNKPYLPKNSKANLIPLCKKCHRDDHHNDIKIDGYVQTSRGKKIKFTKKKNDNNFDDNNFDDNNFDDDEVIDTLNKKDDTKFVDIITHKKKIIRKYNDDDIKKIKKLQKQQITYNAAKNTLKNEYDMNISIPTIKKIWSNIY
jgi:DNA mismatch repair protein MutS